MVQYNTFQLPCHYLQSGATPLYTASKKGHLDVVKELLAKGATISKAKVVRQALHESQDFLIGIF